MDCSNQSAHPRFLASELPPCAPESALFHIISAPLEASVSYGGGTAKGPAAIIAASDQLELWDGESVPADLGIYTWPPLDCDRANRVEMLPAEIPGSDSGPGESVNDPISGAENTVLSVLERIAENVDRVLDCGGLPVLLGGEHTVTFGALKALAKRAGRFGVVQFDAHADLRDSYEGSPFSHACVMRRAVKDLGLPLVSFGVRALCLEEVAARREHGVCCWDAARLALEGLPENPLPEDFPEQIYVTFDVDGLDPSIMPATGTPVPGGPGWYEALALAKRAMQGRKVLGFDVVELAPIPGLHMADFTAARLVYALMGIVQRNSVL